MGYIGYSRSERSELDISCYIVPLSMIDRELINKFFEDWKEEYKEEDIKNLKKVSISIVKYVGKHKVGRDSWHHTSAMYNETDHYSLENIFNYILENGTENIKELYCKYKEKIDIEKEEIKKEYEYVSVTVAIFGRRNGGFKHLYDKYLIGIMVGRWIYYYADSNHTEIKKCSRYSNSVTINTNAQDYKSLVKANKDCKGLSKIFNKLIKDLKLKGTIKGE